MKQYVKLTGSGWESIGMHNLICEVISSTVFYTIEHNGKIYTNTASKTNSDPFYCEEVSAPTNDQLIKNITELTELDALAEKIFIYCSGDYQFHAPYAYTRAQEFLNYKKRRNEK